MGSAAQDPGDWQQRAARKRQACLDQIPRDWLLPQSLLESLPLPLEEHATDLVGAQVVRRSGLLSQRELRITEGYTLAQLLAALAEGSLTALEVTVAYSKRAAIAQQLVSCLTETMFPEAQARAKYLDELRSQGQSAGPLHGLPVSLKDSFHVKGTDSTIGMMSFLGDPSTQNSPLVDLLVNLGAVVYVKTNVPQTMMTADSHNNLFGRTLNPRNTSLGPGGSSGGEGALIALRGSPLGVGTDIGGSIRIPALCCGIYGFRPSASRIPNGGMRFCSTPGMKFILSCAGPLATDIDSLRTFCQTVIGGRPALYDSTVIDVPWRPVTTKPSLRIGVVPDDPVFPLQPPVRRALEEAARSLEAQGHTLVRLSADECQISKINAVAWNIFALDGRSRQHLADAGEPPVPALANIFQMFEKLKKAHPSPLTDAGDMDRLERFAMLNAVRGEQRDAWREIWVRHHLDICLAPPAQSTAMPHDHFGLTPYTSFLNSLDYPSCIIPVGQVGESDSTEQYKVDDSQTGPPYHFEQVQGMPCSVQVFTSTMRDEECLQMAQEIDSCLNRT